jgi:hypothetical protein
MENNASFKENIIALATLISETQFKHALKLEILLLGLPLLVLHLPLPFLLILHK